MYRQLEEQLRTVGPHPVVVDTLCSFAQETESQGQKVQAERLYRRALASGQTMLGDEHPATLQAAHMLALAIAKQGNCAEAVQLLSGVLAGREESLAADHPDTLAVRLDLRKMTDLLGKPQSS